MENLDLIVDNGNSNPVSGPNTNLVISQQEVVSSVADLGLKKPFQLSKYQIIKQESVENTDEPLQINLDPGHMLSEAGIGDIPNIIVAGKCSVACDFDQNVVRNTLNGPNICH